MGDPALEEVANPSSGYKRKSDVDVCL